MVLIIEHTFIKNIIDILLCCNRHHYYYTLSYTHTHIYKSCLTNKLNLLIILNLVLESSTARILLSLSLSPLQPTISFSLLNGLYCCWRRFLPHHR